MAYLNAHGPSSPYDEPQSDLPLDSVSENMISSQQFSQTHSTVYRSSRFESELDEKKYSQIQVSNVDQASERTSVNSNSAHRKHFILLWWQEVAACIVAVLAFVGLIIILVLYQDKPSPAWPSAISLNTIISIFTTLFEGAVLLVLAEGLGQLKWVWLAEDCERPLEVLLDYDSAIQGSNTGALALIWKLKFTRILSSAGAVIMILAIAIDPLAQQIIQYYDCQVSSAELDVSIPRTNYYAVPIGRGGHHSGPITLTLPPDLQNSVNAAILNPNLTPAFTCETGNCTWAAEYSSVGFCSACNDISNEIVFRNTSHTDASTESTTRNLTTSIPNGLSLTNSDHSATFEWAAMGSTNASLLVEGNGAAIDFVLGRMVDGAVDPMNNEAWADCSDAAAADTWRCKGFGASRCFLSPCIKTFSASVEANTLTEKLLSTAEAWSAVRGDDVTTPIASLDTQCINAGEAQALRSLGYTIENGTRWIAYNFTFPTQDPANLPDAFPDSLALRGCVYALDFRFGASMRVYLDKYFDGLVGGYRDEISGPLVVQAMWNFGDVSFDRVSGFMENVSVSLTNYMRENGVQGYSAPATGLAAQNKACVAVRWPYLAFPAAMLLFVLVFFGVVLVKTRPTGGRPAIWKSSTLPMLVQSLSQEAGDAPRGETEEMGPGTELERMETFAKTKKVSLKDLMRGAALSAADEVRNVYE